MIPLIFVFFLCITSASAQPRAVADGVLFTYENNQATRVLLGADWNGWNPDNTPMKKADGLWQAVVKLEPGVYHYKFVADGNWLPDPKNPARVDDMCEQLLANPLVEDYEVQLEEAATT